MSEQPPVQSTIENQGPARSTPLRYQMRQTAISAAIAAVLMLFFGFTYGFEGEIEPTAYSISQAVFLATLRIGGILMVLSALLLVLGVRSALLLDAIFAGLIGVALLGVGIVWIAIGIIAIDSVLLVLFGGMFLHSARQSWLGHRDLMRTDDAMQYVSASPAAAPSIEPDETAAAIEPDNSTESSDGYLAELGRSDEDDRPTS
jgi:hypothetical protein